MAEDKWIADLRAVSEELKRCRAELGDVHWGSDLSVFISRKIDARQEHLDELAKYREKRRRMLPKYQERRKGVRKEKLR